MQPSTKPTNPLIAMPGRNESAESRQAPQPGLLVCFLLACAGAIPDIIHREECRADRTRLIAIGTLIVTTFCMASISASFALFAVFKSLGTALPLGCFWGWNTAAIERFFVLTIKKTQAWSPRSLMMAIPRLAMAAATAAVISAPLELRIFQPEIELQMASDSARARTLYQKEAVNGFPEVERLEAEKTQLAAEIAEAEKTRDAAQKSAITEAEGIEGTLRPGFGRVYLEKREYLETRSAELNRVRKENEARIREIEAKLADRRAERDSAVSTLMSSRNRSAGLLARLRALREIESDPDYGTTLSTAIRLVFLLLLMVETAPVLGKLLMRRGAYDALLEARENAAISHSCTIVESMNRSLKRRSDHDADLEERARSFEREAFTTMLADVRSSPAYAEAQRESAANFLSRLRGRLAKFVSPEK